MNGRTCLITGATDGIGKETAIELAKKGCNLILIGRNKEKGEKVVEQIRKVADNYVDMEFGTGCVKVTPAHDSNDFDMGQRHSLDIINVMHSNATINSNAPKK